VTAKAARVLTDLLGEYGGEQPDRTEAGPGDHICQPVHAKVNARPTDSDEHQRREDGREHFDVQRVLAADDEVCEGAQDDR
jgi:hypothetical protein